MSKDFQAQATGNLTRDPELRFLASGQAVCNFSLAINEQKKNKDTGRWEDDGVTFCDVVVWAQMAENVAASLQKGNRVHVSGTMRQEDWEKDGAKFSRLKLTADTVGPDLRFATASIQRIERSQGGGHQAQQAPPPAADNPYATTGEEPF